MRRASLISALGFAVLAGVGCGCAGNDGSSGAGRGGPARPDSTRQRVSGPLPARGTIVFRIPGVRSGARMPKRYTCDGAGISPPLRWSRIPAGTRSMIMLVTDPDARGGPFFHWAAYDFPASPRGVAAGAAPFGSKQGLNSNREPRWTPPCPPKGDLPHRYYFQIWAESRPTGLGPDEPRPAVAYATSRHLLGYGMFALRYSR